MTARKESAGDYQIGIWSVRREGRRWLAQATGPGTIGDGNPHYYPTLNGAHLALTGEPLRQSRTIRQTLKPGKAYRCAGHPGANWMLAISATHFLAGPDGWTRFFASKQAALAAAEQKEG